MNTLNMTDYVDFRCFATKFHCILCDTYFGLPIIVLGVTKRFEVNEFHIEDSSRDIFRF